MTNEPITCSKRALEPNERFADVVFGLTMLRPWSPPSRHCFWSLGLASTVLPPTLKTPAVFYRPLTVAPADALSAAPTSLSARGSNRTILVS